MPSFECRTCSSSFEVSQSALERYPGWTPRQCLKCKKSDGEGRSSTAKQVSEPRKKAARSRISGAAREEDLTVAEILEKYTDGPQTGVFTDGASHPNPGPGGWGAVYVKNGELQAEAFGHEPNTTNNRMELTAIIHAFDLVPAGAACDVWTDSQLCVNTINQWAAGWARNGWKRKTGEIKNLDLIQELYAKAKARPELKLRWIKAHSGNRWNEYADALSTAYRRAHK
jgi:ribonuclease HI